MKEVCLETLGNLDTDFGDDNPFETSSGVMGAIVGRLESKQTALQSQCMHLWYLWYL